MDRIAITGLGIVSPSGIDKRKFWANVKAGRSAVEKITRFDASKYPSHIAGQVHELDVYSKIILCAIHRLTIQSIDCGQRKSCVGSKGKGLGTDDDIRASAPPIK